MKARVSDNATVRTVVGDLAGLDRLTCESFALFVPSDVRPLRGVAGFVDWRTNGVVSRTLLGGMFQGTADEVLLTATRGRLGNKRCFLFGLGPINDCHAEQLERVCDRASRILRRARAQPFAFGAPSAPGRRDLERIFVEMVGKLGKDSWPDVVLIPPPVNS